MFGHLSDQMLYEHQHDLDVLNRVFNVRAYGASGNGIANDTVAINAAIRDLNLAGSGVLRFPPGHYISNGGHTIAVPFMVQGYGNQGYQADQGVSNVLCTSPTTPLLTITANAGLFSRISLVNAAATQPSAGSAIYTNSANLLQKIDYHHVTARGFYDNFDIKVGTAWVMRGCNSFESVRYGIRIRNTLNRDAGDWSISDCNVWAGRFNSQAGIRIESSSAGKITNVKTNGSQDFTAHVNAIEVEQAPEECTILLITNCSFENYTGDGIKVMSPWKYIVISNCQWGQYLSASGRAIHMAGVDYFTIANCIMRGPGAPVGINLDDCNHGKLTGNVMVGYTDNVVQTDCSDITIS